MDEDDFLSRYLEDEVRNSLPADDVGESPSDGTSSNTFCTESNVINCVQYLNSSLYQLGLPCLPLALQSPEPISTYAIAETLNAFYAVLRLQQENASLLKEKHDQLSRAFNENEHLRQNNVKLEDKLDKALRKVAHEQAKEAAAQAKFKAQEAKREQLKAEQQKQILALKHKDTNYLHEMRKREGEYNRLKERLRATADNKKETAAIAITNAAPKASASSSRNTMASTDIMVARYESKIQSLTLENQALRETLVGMDAEFKELVEQMAPQSEAPEATPQLRRAKKVEKEGTGPKPFHQFIQDIERGHRETLHQLKDCVATQGLAAVPESEYVDTSELSKEVLRLSQLLEENKKVIAEQEQLLKMAVAEGPTVPLSPSPTSEVSYLKSQLEAERALWQAKEKNFKEERERVTAATIELANDRAAFESEKRAFRMQLLHWQNATKNSTTPMTRSTPNRTRITPLTCFSPFSLRGAALLREGSGSAPGTPTHPSDISLEIYARAAAQDPALKPPPITLTLSTQDQPIEANKKEEKKEKEKEKETEKREREKGKGKDELGDDSFLREWEMEIEAEKEHDSPLRLPSRTLKVDKAFNSNKNSKGQPPEDFSFDAEMALLSPIPPPKSSTSSKKVLGSPFLSLFFEKENVYGN